MSKIAFALLFGLLSIVCSPLISSAQQDQAGEVDRPKVFLDKSPRIVQFQLKRLENERLLLVEREPTDEKYLPVYEAILTREGMSQENREQSLAAIVQIKGSSQLSEALRVLDQLDGDDASSLGAIQSITSIILQESPEQLAQQAELLAEATRRDASHSRAVAYAALLKSGIETIPESAEAWGDAFAGLALVPDQSIRDRWQSQVMWGLKSEQPLPVRRAAARALATLTPTSEAFVALAELVAEDDLRSEAVRSLLKLPDTVWEVSSSETLAHELVQLAERTDAAERTNADFQAAMQLADRAIARLPIARAKPLRDRLSKVTVRVVRIETVEEEMRYATTVFAVQAGRPVQVALVNQDLMPHNLVITKPGKLKEVALLGAKHGPNPGYQDKLFVPISDDVLFATNMVANAQQDTITFTAPETPGEYPYVCTFPNHWMRMYGVMVVVEDLDAWLANPTEPKDPLGLSRKFVANWKPEDIPGDLALRTDRVDLHTAAVLFEEATCLQCHQMGKHGGKVGPELTEVLSRHQGDHRAVLREMLEPSYKIDPKYTLYNVVTSRGLVLSGIVTAQDKKTVTLLTNPDDPRPQVISRDDIEEMSKSSASMMPKGLLDRYTEQEIVDLLGYITSGKPIDPHAGHHAH